MNLLCLSQFSFAVLDHTETFAKVCQRLPRFELSDPWTSNIHVLFSIILSEISQHYKNDCASFLCNVFDSSEYWQAVAHSTLLYLGTLQYGQTDTCPFSVDFEVLSCEAPRHFWTPRMLHRARCSAILQGSSVEWMNRLAGSYFLQTHCQLPPFAGCTLSSEIRKRSRATATQHLTSTGLKEVSHYCPSQ